MEEQPQNYYRINGLNSIYLSIVAEETANQLLSLIHISESVIKRRIEQLEEVAMVDVTGLVERQVQIVPDEDKLAMMGLSIEYIESALAANNVEPGSMTVRDGYYAVSYTHLDVYKRQGKYMVSLFLIIPYMHLQGLSIIRDLTRDIWQ